MEKSANKGLKWVIIIGMLNDIDDYSFDYKTISGPEISIKNVESKDKTVIIALPVDGMKLGDKTLVVCFMEISMKNLLEGVSLKSDNNNTTFVNIYTRDGVALTDMVLGGLASEDNLITAMAKTVFLSNMSHEIRTPMNAIIGLDNIALNDPKTPEKTREYLVKIGESAKHLLTIINDILDMSRIESGRMAAEKVAAFDDKPTLRFTISDTGIGMSKEYLPHIFDTFSQEDSTATNKYGSSGLGMAITKSIVEMMNGKIEAESEKGVGTTFTVTVTLQDSERRMAEEMNLPRPEEMTVLVVDDDPLACENAKLVLGQAGIATETAGSGEEAIEQNIDAQSPSSSGRG